nr:hypothetical protein Iba_chr08aCG7200 [Ipomoea batatas]
MWLGFGCQPPTTLLGSAQVAQLGLNIPLTLRPLSSAQASRGSSLAKNFNSMIRRKSCSVPPLGNIKLLFGQGSCPAKLRLFDSVVSEVVPIPPPGNVQFLESQVA